MENNCISDGEECQGEGAGCDQCRGETPCCSGNYTGCGAEQVPRCGYGCTESGEDCVGEGNGCEKCTSGSPCCSGEYEGCGAFQTPKCK